MKYMVNKKLIGILFVIFLIMFADLTIQVSGNYNSSAQELNEMLEIIEQKMDYFATVLTLTITIVLAIKNYREHRLSCIINVAATILCLVLILVPRGFELWEDVGTLLGLASVLIGYSVEPIDSCKVSSD